MLKTQQEDIQYNVIRLHLPKGIFDLVMLHIN